jgi:ComF family protein
VGILDRAIRMVIDVVYPEVCLLCGRGFPAGTVRRGPVCAACSGGIHPLSGARCLDCGLPLISERERCVRCRGRSFAFDRHRALFAYAEEVRELVYYYKFRGRAGLAAFFAERLVKERLWEGEPRWVVPVPARGRRVRRLGFAPVKLLTARFSRLSGIPLLDCLTMRAGRSQKTLDIDERLANLSGRISAMPRRAAALRKAHLLLIDDIFTTGATLHECARVLKLAGAAGVQALSVAQDL